MRRLGPAQQSALDELCDECLDVLPDGLDGVTRRLRDGRHHVVRAVGDGVPDERADVVEDGDRALRQDGADEPL